MTARVVGMAIVNNLDSTKVRLRWDIESHVVVVSCNNIHLASKYLSTLIIAKRITAIKAIVFSEVYPCKIVELYVGERIEAFHKFAHEKRYKPRKFTDLLKSD